MDLLEKNLDTLKVNIDSKEILKRILKYLIQGISIAIAIYIIPAIKLQHIDILFISLTGASTFAIIDLVIPSITLEQKTN